jgi:hypothetical protein
MPGTQKYRSLHRRWLNVTGEGGESFNRRRGPLDLKVMDLEEDMHMAYQIQRATWQVHQEAPVYPIFQDLIRKLSIEQIPDEIVRILRLLRTSAIRALRSSGTKDIVQFEWLKAGDVSAAASI